MSENPYEAPRTSMSPRSGRGVRSGSREDVRRVAVYQKGILFCILINLAVFGGQFFVTPEVAWLLGVALFIGSIGSAVFVFLLAMKVYSTVLGIILGIGALIPLLGLLILLMVNGKATTILRSNGIDVGLLGANLSKI